MRKPAIALLCLLSGGAALAHGMAAWIEAGPYFAILTGQPEVKCCGPSDCEMWPEEDVDAKPDGYHLKSTGEVIPYAKTYATEAEPLKMSLYWRCHNYELLPQFQKVPGTAGPFGPHHPSTHYHTRCFFGPGGAT